MLACGRSCCYGLSHFLQLTFPCWHSRVCFSFHKFHFMLHTAIANRTQELAFIRSLRSIPLHSFITSSPCLFQRTVRAKKMRQTSCRQHPSTALRASCVRGTRSTRSGSHTTHRLNTSFRFSTLAFKPCYQRWLKAVLPRKFGLNLLLPRQPPTTHP